MFEYSFGQLIDGLNMSGVLFVLFLSLPVGSCAPVSHYQAVFFSTTSCLSHALNTEHRTHHDVLLQNFKTRFIHRSTSCGVSTHRGKTLQ